MTVVRVTGKGRTAELTADEIATRRAGAERTIVDAGTGDGRYAYGLASEHPDWFVIALDALDAPMAEIAAKSSRKPAKGGRPNLVFVRASVEALPAELHHVADEVHVLLPWGRLLEGIVRGEADVLAGLAALGHDLLVVLNGEIWEDSMPVRYAGLPVPTPGYVAEVVAPAFAAAGVTVGPAEYLSAAEAKSLPTTWARRLGHGRPHPRFVRFAGSRVAAW